MLIEIVKENKTSSDELEELTSTLLLIGIIYELKKILVKLTITYSNYRNCQIKEKKLGHILCKG